MLKYNFKGFDYTEVIEYFHKKKLYKLKSSKKTTEAETNKHFTTWLSNEFCEAINDPKKQKVFVEPCKAYVKRLMDVSKDYHYTSPLWEGLLKIEHDEVFMTYFIVLFEYMWS